MNQMTEEDIKIITKEEYLNDEGTEQKIIFDSNIFDEIKGKELDLSVEKIFKIPTIKNIFTRKKDEYYVVCQKEHVIDCRYAKGKASIPLVTKRIINKEINDIKSKGDPIKYVHLGGTEILIKACFREGIDTPIELYLADDRIIKPIEKSIITAVKGNLIYQKFKFIISANYSVAVTDRNIDKSLVLYWKISGIELTPGSKIFTARCKNLYVLTTKHKITGKNKINKIQIESPFEQIVKTIDYNDYTYRDIDTEENLEIVNDRISTTKRIANEKPESSSSSKRTSYETNSISNLNQYYITGKINEKEYLILLNTGQEENYIAKYLVKNEEIKTDNDICPDLPRSLINSKNIAEKEIIIGVRKIKIEFEVKEEMQKADIILGIKWLEQVKPYNIEHTQLTLTYNKEKLFLKRALT